MSPRPERFTNAVRNRGIGPTQGTRIRDKGQGEGESMRRSITISVFSGAALRVDGRSRSGAVRREDDPRRKAKKLGGDCLHFGCVPSKTLIRGGGRVVLARRANEFGLPESNSRR